MALVVRGGRGQTLGGQDSMGGGVGGRGVCPEGHYRPEFWQMTNIEYLYGFWGNGYGVLSIEYSYPTSLQ